MLDVFEDEDKGLDVIAFAELGAAGLAESFDMVINERDVQKRLVNRCFDLGRIPSQP